MSNLTFENYNLPSEDEVEITTLGKRADSGESIVIHLGHDKWCIVDSCETDNGEVLPLLFSQERGVNFDNVVFVVCSHWHTDHIRGLSKIVGACKNAKFIMSKAGKKEDFLRYVVYKTATSRKGSKYSELKDCLSCIALREKERKSTFKAYAFMDKVLHDDNNVSICSLSPSDAILDAFDQVLLDNDKDGSEISDNSIDENLYSIALIVKGNFPPILVGGDLQIAFKRKSTDFTECDVEYCVKHKDYGWCNVVKNSSTMKDNIGYIKIPHHSSITSFCAKMWNERMGEKVIGVSTMFINNKGVFLPQKKMLEIYFDKCAELYVTFDKPYSYRDRKGGRAKIDDVLSPQNGKIVVLPEKIGAVSSRWNSTEKKWKTSLFGSATRVNKKFIDNYKNQEN